MSQQTMMISEPHIGDDIDGNLVYNPGVWRYSKITTLIGNILQ